MYYDGTCGIELVTPILTGVDDVTKVSRVVEALRAGNIPATPRCAMHFRSGRCDGNINANNMANLIRFLTRYQEVFYTIAAPHRRLNAYGGPWGSESLRLVRDIIGKKDCCDSTIHTLAERTRRGFIGLKSWKTMGVEIRAMQSELSGAYVEGVLGLAKHLADHFLDNNAEAEIVRAGNAEAKSPRILLQTFLERGGFYSDRGSAEENQLRIKTRKFILAQFHRHQEPSSLT
jgi:hypothetical protein